MSSKLQRFIIAEKYVDKCLDCTVPMWFTLSSDPRKSTAIANLVNWYMVKRKQFYVDRHPCCEEVIEVLKLRWREDWSHTCLDKNVTQFELPLVFLEKKCLGTYDSIIRYEEERKLKDLLQFSLMWPMKPKERNEAPPSAFGDEVAFRAIWRGTPMARPVMPTPKFTRFD
eukprot:PhM_4_TR16697/c0_g2_i1/m.40237